MNKESFLDTIRDQYREEIREAYLESEHHEKIDYSELKYKLSHLKKAAALEGLPHKDFEDLVKCALPEEVFEKLNLNSDENNRKEAA